MVTSFSNSENFFESVLKKDAAAEIFFLQTSSQNHESAAAFQWHRFRGRLRAQDTLLCNNLLGV